MKNIALCFDRDRDGVAESTNASVSAVLLQRSADQIVWSPTCPGHRRGAFGAGHTALDAARAAVAGAYGFLVDEWAPGDGIFLFGAGRGAVSAYALARLLGTVGVLNGDVPGWTTDDFREYALSTYALPRTPRDAADWRRIAGVVAGLSDRDDVAVEVAFLGLWDCVAPAGFARAGAVGRLPTVRSARHAVAIDGGYPHPGPQLLGGAAGGGVEEVWFRGTHGDITGGRGARPWLAGVALDWVLDGAVRAGAALRQCPERYATRGADALAGGVPAVTFRKVPEEATVHASVQCFLRAHPSYWRRLPSRVVWADPDWDARSERLVPGSAAPPPAAEIPALVAAS